MLTIDDTAFGIPECALDLFELYPDLDVRSAFLSRFDDFLKSDRVNQWIFSLQGNTLNYRSEVFVSEKVDSRLPLLLLHGNAASHSVDSRMCFAYEGDGREHRFWKVLAETGILTFLEQPPQSADLEATIEMKRSALKELKYISPFRIGIAVFYSFPTSASLGVSSLKTLFGAKAFEAISLQEEQRIDKLIAKFMGSTGGIIAFQKDAYERVRSTDSPAYSQELANQGVLLGKYKNSKGIFLAGSPPTRLIQSGASKLALRKFKDWFCEHLSAPQQIA